MTQLYTLSNLGVTSCFYASSSGVDTNSGTDESHPWLHLPGMWGCSHSCASTTPKSGEGFIVEGGSSYHFSGAGTPVGLPWVWSWSGTSGRPIYLGVDRTWYSGSSWARPILTGDNPTTTELTVSDCTYANDNDHFVTLKSSTSYVVLDNFEATGGCYSTPNGFAYFYSASSTHNMLSNDYAHGWSRASRCSGSGCGNTPAAFLSDNGANVSPYNVWAFDVVDGSDTAGNIVSGIQWNCYDIHASVIRYVGNQLCNAHTVHDTWIDHTTEPTFSGDHGNTFEENGSFTGYGANSWYNNVVSHMNTAVGIWLNPQAGFSCAQGGCDYVFNNVIYAAGPTVPGNYFNIGQNQGPAGNWFIFNNTFEDPNNGTILQCDAKTQHRFDALNNHYITDSRSPYSAVCTGGEFGTELAMTHAAATSQGYTSAEASAYSPAKSTDATVQRGSNEATTLCAALAIEGDTTAAIACRFDTGYACTYNSVTHSVSCPGRRATIRPQPGSTNWDIGAYRFMNTVVLGGATPDPVDNSRR